MTTKQHTSEDADKKLADASYRIKRKQGFVKIRRQSFTIFLQRDKHSKIVSATDACGPGNATL